MKEILVITADGQVLLKTLSGDSTADWKLMTDAVGGYVERVPLEDYTLLMWVNEEGKLRGLPHNPLAQRLWDKSWGVGTDYVVGDVVITGDDTDEGETGGLPADVTNRLVLELTGTSV